MVTSAPLTLIRERVRDCRESILDTEVLLDDQSLEPYSLGPFVELVLDPSHSVFQLEMEE